MRATIARAWHVLRAGRAPAILARDLAGSAALAAMLYACACAFLLMEPLP